MARDDDDSVFCAGIFCHDVVNREISDRSLGCEGVILYRVSLEASVDVVFDFFVVRTAQRTRTELDDVFHVLHGTVAIDLRQRTPIRRKCDWLDRGLGSRGGGGRTTLALGRFLITITGEHN